MRDPLRTAGTEIRRIVAAALAAGEPEAIVLERVNTYLVNSGLDESLKQWFVEQATAQFTWISDRTLSGQALADLTTIFETAGSEFASVGGQVQEKVVKEIIDGIHAGRTSSELSDILQRKFDHGRAQSRTVVNTALLGLNRTKRIRTAEIAGVTRFKYSGPSPDRPFCRQHYKKIYTREEISGLSNGQISPVRIYCGGYNCRHQWVPIVD